MLNNKLLVDLAYEYCTAEELADLSNAVIQRLSGLRNVYKIPGQWFKIEHTERPVGGHNPPCGGGRPYDPGLVQSGQHIMGMGFLLAEAPIAGAIVFAVGALITAFGSLGPQGDCNCIAVTNLLPGRLDPTWVEEHVTVQYFFDDDDDGNREVSPGELPWAYFGKAVVPSTPYVDISVKPSPRHDADRCTMTTMASLLKNWSHTRIRRARIDLYLDALPVGAEGCADYSIINRELYEEEIVRLIPVEIQQRLLKQYATDLLGSI